MISFSVAFDPNFGIGKNGKLPWHIKDDLRLFKENTLHKNILMGQTTFDNMPGKLKDRHTIIVSIDPTYTSDGDDNEVIYDLIKFLKEHENDEEEYVVCGGASIYAQSYPYCKKAYISFVKEARDCDTFFKGYKESDWLVTKEVDYPEFTYRELIKK